MKTSQKLREVFENIRPHINGHRTMINQFLESINEVEEIEALSQHCVSGCVCDEEDKHGWTTVKCCNECGLSVEEFWNKHTH